MREWVGFALSGLPGQDGPEEKWRETWKGKAVIAFMLGRSGWLIQDAHLLTSLVGAVTGQPQIAPPPGSPFTPLTLGPGMCRAPQQRCQLFQQDTTHFIAAAGSERHHELQSLGVGAGLMLWAP